MPDETFPIVIGGKKYSLRVLPDDVDKIEETISLFEAFHPHLMTYKNAAMILWRMLWTESDDGKLVYAIQQGPAGFELARQMTRQFCHEGFVGTAGMLVLYESFRRAIVKSGYWGEPKPEDKPKKPTEVHEKNLATRTAKRTKKSHSESAD